MSTPETVTTPPGHLLQRHSFPIRWGDMDALGHVNNTVYFRYFEQTRMNWYDSLGSAVLGNSSTGMVIVDAHCEYLIPIVYPAQVIVTMYGGVPGRSSFNSFYHIHIEGDERLFTRGAARIVWIETHKGKSCPLPEAAIKQLPEK